MDIPSGSVLRGYSDSGQKIGNCAAGVVLKQTVVACSPCPSQ